MKSGSHGVMQAQQDWHTATGESPAIIVHCLPDSFKLHVLALMRQYYPDFSPTLAAEKLRERHDIVVFVETLRKWMIADGLWLPYVRRKPRIYQPRNRRDCRGELIQIDGSPHDGLKDAPRNAVKTSWCMTIRTAL